ncbi:SemiSWEET transporter [Chitinilyticum aquatile]|uniref:SemiSWEET transporter n=1 Tax=Chitinilyticum aquatile TaxID=362520 RepID=UPI0004190193
MMYQDLLGLAAAICTTVAFVPQVWQVWRSRSAKDISLGMYLIFITGVALWLVYGILGRDLPLILANSVTLLLAGSVLVMKLVFERRAGKPAA